MKQLILLLLTVLTSSTSTFSQEKTTTTSGKKVLLYEDGSWVYADSVQLYNIRTKEINSLEIPTTQTNEVVISHIGYSLSYNETHEQANWIAYELTNEETKKTWERTDKFLRDPKVKTGTAYHQDYSGSGYDRGHLAPASDMSWSATAMAESFYYSNMSPQEPGFNRGVWKRLEGLIRTWAVDYESVFIVTGPVLTNDLTSIGNNKVSVPKYYYKVILDYREPSIKGIGFIISNTSSSEQLQLYAVTIDSVEKLTGIDFFPLLADAQENSIESTLNIKSWNWKSSKASNSEEELKATTSVQCKGVTKAGAGCHNKTLNVSGYCYQHIGQINTTNERIKTTPNITPKSSSTAVQCSGKSQAGNRCKRRTTSSRGRCYQH
ncbi:MAG: endonuclease G [Bacteroidia bacterium]|jgi:endonuclease G